MKLPLSLFCVAILVLFSVILSERMFFSLLFENCFADYSESDNSGETISGDSGGDTTACVASASQFCAGQDNYFSQWLLSDPAARAALAGIEINPSSDHPMSADQFGKIATYIETNSDSLQKIQGAAIDVGNIFNSIFPDTSKAGIVPVTDHPTGTSSNVLPSTTDKDSDTLSKTTTPTAEQLSSTAATAATQVKEDNTGQVSSQSAKQPVETTAKEQTNTAIVQAGTYTENDNSGATNNEDKGQLGDNVLPALTGSEAVVAGATVGAGGAKIKSMMP